MALIRRDENVWDPFRELREMSERVNRVFGGIDPWLVTTTILTTAAQGDLRAIHDRQPVVLGPESWSPWLDPTLEVATAEAVQVLYDYAANRPRPIPDDVVVKLEAYEGRSLRA